MIDKFAGEISGVSNKGTKLKMKDVLFVPELLKNLMSVKKLVKAGVDVIFSGSIALLKKGEETIATAHLRGGLYELEMNVDEIVSALCKSENEFLWHQRLGHLSQQGMLNIVKNNLTVDVEFNGDEFKFCDACIKANGTRSRATRPLERIHSVWSVILCGV